MIPPRRPSRVYVDEELCISCEVCEDVAPGTLAAAALGPFPADEPVLDAMAACPTGAIRWWEGETPDEAA